MSMSAPVHGAVLLESGSVRFSIWAPDARQLALELTDSRAHVDPQLFTLEAGPQGLFTTTVDCKAGATYQYLINEELRVPDPASRAQLDDVHGPSVVVDPRAFQWKTTDWQGRP